MSKRKVISSFFFFFFLVPIVVLRLKSPAEGEEMNLWLSQGYYYKMKYKQTCPGFELGYLSPFPMKITISPEASSKFRSKENLRIGFSRN